ncbi:MAG: NAD(+) synthase [Candidatus Poribacteria bacterium]
MKLEMEKHNNEYWGRISEIIQRFIKDKIKELNKNGAIIGLSGGIDSAVVAKLAVESLGSDKVKALLLPERDTNKENMSDALAFAKELKIDMFKVNITGILRQVGTYRIFFPYSLLPKTIKRKLSDIQYKRLIKMGFEKVFLEILRGSENTDISKIRAYLGSKVRTRMVVTYFYADLWNLLVLGTVNKSELMLGYFIKYGDAGVDIAPIADLYKTEIFDFARFLKIPEKIINKAPSADLSPGITDEGSLGITYQSIDRILLGIEKGLSDDEICYLTDERLEDVQYIRSLTIYSKPMRELPYSPNLI